MNTPCLSCLCLLDILARRCLVTSVGLPPQHGGDSWCWACSVHKQLWAELKAAWGSAGSRQIATDLAASCLRQIRALRRLGLASGAGGSKPPEPAGPPPGVAAKASTVARERSAGPPPRSERDGVKPFVKEEAEEEDDHRSDSYETEEGEVSEEEEKTTSPKARAVRPVEDMHHREGASSSHRPSTRRSRSRGELPRLRSRGRPSDHRKERSGHHPRRRRRPGHRAGSRHQKWAKAAEDPYRKFHHRQPDSFWDQDHFDR